MISWPSFCCFFSQFSAAHVVGMKTLMCPSPSVTTPKTSTLKIVENGQKFQALGWQLIFDDINWTIAYGVQPCNEGSSAVQVAAIIKRTNGIFGMKDEYLRTVMSDFAAIAVADVMRKEKEDAHLRRQRPHHRRVSPNVANSSTTS